MLTHEHSILAFQTSVNVTRNSTTKCPHLSVAQLVKERCICCSKEAKYGANPTDCQPSNNPESLSKNTQRPNFDSRPNTSEVPGKTRILGLSKILSTARERNNALQYSPAPEAKFSKRVDSPIKVRRSVPVGPLRCLPMMSSAVPFSAVSGL